MSAASGQGHGREPSGAFLWVRDIAVAALAVGVVIGAVFAYSGTWPPMVVIESSSMQHSSERSYLGVIDTGDLTLVKKVASDADIVTYMQGERTGYSTYGNFGDVIIYSMNGHSELTPIIHRAITRVAFNRTMPNGTMTFDFPEIARADRFDVPAAGLFDLGPVRTWHGADGEGRVDNLVVNLGAIANSLAGLSPADLAKVRGFITKGDHNPGIDQGHLPVFRNRATPTVQPVAFEWVVGKAQGELPWFGGIKLWASGAPCSEANRQSCVPGNSWTNLAIAIAVIAVGPYALEKGWERYGDRVTERIPQGWRKRWHAAWDRLPGGAKRATRREERRRELEGIRKRRGGRRHVGRSR